MSDDLQPDVEEVLQVEPYGDTTPVGVTVQGPVRTQALPRKAASTKRITAQALPSPFRILSANPRRASAVLIADAAFYVAFNNASAQDASTMAEWPALVPLTITADTDIWVAAVTGTADVSAVVEQWATGEGDE